MATKEIEIHSVNGRVFINEVMKYAAKGATFPETSPFFKSPTFRIRLSVADSVSVDENPNVRVVPQEIKQRERTEVKVESTVVTKGEDGKYTKDYLESLSIKDLRSVLGVTTGKDKNAMIEKYLKVEDKPAEENKTEVTSEDKPEDDKPSE
jgi:hypothetical protein